MAMNHLDTTLIPALLEAGLLVAVLIYLFRSRKINRTHGLFGSFGEYPGVNSPCDNAMPGVSINLRGNAKIGKDDQNR